MRGIMPSYIPSPVADGPLALLPTEIEIEDVEDDIMQSLLDHHEWRLQANSVDTAEVERELRELRAGALPSAEYRTFSTTRSYLPTQMVGIGFPPNHWLTLHRHTSPHIIT